MSHPAATEFGKPIYTVGHSTRSIEEFTEILLSFNITFLVDVRSFPRSRRNAQFNSEILAPALADKGIAYEHLRDLGGLRGRKGLPRESSNVGWDSPSFRNYADYAETEAFARALEKLRERAAGARTAIMCAEAVWWRCHRRIITDYLLARGQPVVHILAKNRYEPAHLTEFAVVGSAGKIHYPRG